ncbi:MAG TPA: EcsC family protein [Syntrophomonadaceae bacterium]|nr:EcsC family protein [Syntrophomonadaceae bacterium]HQD90910.1 EcsC family protein [Syntrophomonadaceae bacterium]
MPGNKRPNDCDDKASALEKIINWIVDTNPTEIVSYVDKLREQNPGITDDELAKKIVSRKAIKNGLVGAIAGIPGFIALPVTVPTDLVASWKIQSYMAVAIAYVYGHTSQTTDLKTDIYLILAGDAAKEALKRMGIEISKEVTKKAIDKYITREVMKKIWKVVGQRIITKAGEKSLTSFMKMVPLVGAPIGYGFDWFATRAVGYTAIKYYSS